MDANKKKKSLAKKMIGSGKIERTDDWEGKPMYKATLKTKSGESSGIAGRRHNALGNAMFDSGEFRVSKDHPKPKKRK